MDQITGFKYIPGTIIKHNKRGSTYEIVNVAYIESTATPSYIYKCVETGVIWVRPISEIEDENRFSNCSKTLTIENIIKIVLHYNLVENVNSKFWLFSTIRPNSGNFADIDFWGFDTVDNLVRDLLVMKTLNFITLGRDELIEKLKSQNISE